MATLFVVATPIGNLEDLSLRAIRVLEQAPVIAAEDTRVVRKLLSHLGVPTPRLIALTSHASPGVQRSICEALEQGMDVALVSDAGTPGIADPGAEVVARVRSDVPDAVIVAVPGPSAVSAALSISGIVADSYVFMGFPPHKKGRATFFADIVSRPETVVFFESPHRIEKALSTLTELAADRQLILMRELTKRFETVLTGTPADIHERMQTDPNQSRGEFVLILPPSPKA